MNKISDRDNKLDKKLFSPSICVKRIDMICLILDIIDRDGFDAQITRLTRILFIFFFHERSRCIIRVRTFETISQVFYHSPEHDNVKFIVDVLCRISFNVYITYIVRVFSATVINCGGVTLDGIKKKMLAYAFYIISACKEFLKTRMTVIFWLFRNKCIENTIIQLSAYRDVCLFQKIKPFAFAGPYQNIIVFTRTWAERTRKQHIHHGPAPRSVWFFINDISNNIILCSYRYSDIIILLVGRSRLFIFVWISEECTPHNICCFLTREPII